MSRLEAIEFSPGEVLNSWKGEGRKTDLLIQETLEVSHVSSGEMSKLAIEIREASSNQAATTSPNAIRSLHQRKCRNRHSDPRDREVANGAIYSSY